MDPKRIILDTNLWISFLISNKLNELDSLLKSGNIIILISPELLNEFLEGAVDQNLKSILNHRILKSY